MSDLFTPQELLWQRLEQQVAPRDGSIVRAAYARATAAHAGQSRFEGTPYIVHPLRVALLLAGRPELNPDGRVLAAALLHDVVEDSPYTTADLADEFGAEIAAWVDLLTKPPKASRVGDWEDRYYDRLKAGPLPARLIKLADRLDNLAGLHLRPLAKQIEYRLETRDRLLPLAAVTDGLWEAELRRLCDPGGAAPGGDK